MRAESMQRCRRWLGWLVMAAGFSALTGCGMIYKTTGDVLVGYGEADMMPYVLTNNDVPMACGMGKSLTPLLMSFESVGSDPDKLGVMVYTTAATCSDAHALDAQLRYMRDIKSGDVTDAQDARIVQKRWAAISASRQWTAYKRALKAYGGMKDGQCPDLDSDFDQTVWMVGMLSGLQALLNDTTAGGAVGVPRNIAANAAEGATCLNNDKWWGVPEGIQGVVWNMLPMLAPKGADSWQMLEDSAKKGLAGGVRLGSALYAMAAYSKGDTERLKTAIRDFAANDNNVNPDYRLIDAFAREIVQGLSDRLWTKATGKRTPYGDLGTFWDDAPATPQINIQDLLN